MPYLLFFFLLGLQNVPPAAQTPTLAVSVAVPEDNGQRIIRLSTSDPHFDVVIRNVSAHPQELYAEDCSRGYNTLRLELLSIDGKPLPQPIMVERIQHTWFSNVIRTVTLEPGEVMVREVHLTKDLPLLGVHYSNFPPLDDYQPHKLRMRAVFAAEQGDGFTLHFHRTPNVSFSSTATPGSEHTPALLWTGRVVSDTKDYSLMYYSP